MREKILKNELGNIHSVLWESRDSNGKWYGYTENYLRSEMLNSALDLENQISKVKIIDFSHNFENCIVKPV
jgi:hypothetical protein